MRHLYTCDYHRAVLRSHLEEGRGVSIRGYIFLLRFLLVVRCSWVRHQDCGPQTGTVWFMRSRPSVGGSYCAAAKCFGMQWCSDL